MLHTKESQARTKKELQMVVLNDHNRFAVEERNGNISFNLTMMAKPYRKTPKDWRRTDEAKSYLKAFSVRQKCLTADLLEVRQGGTPETQGTWATDYRIAIRFAQWLDMNFAIAVDELIYKILTKQAIVVEPKYGVLPIIDPKKGRIYSYMDAMRSLGGSTKSSCSRRKKAHPQHFVMRYGRNFVSEHYLELLHSYYHYKNNVKQLTLPF